MRSILSKINILRSDLSQVKFNVCCITETWLKPNVCDQLLSLSGFKFCRLDRSVTKNDGSLKTGGGVVTYYKDDYSSITIDEATSCTVDLEILGIVLSKQDHQKIVVINLYRPPNGNIVCAIKKLNDVLEFIIKSYKNFELFVVGDLNINLLTRSRDSVLFSETCGYFSLFNLINTPTRITVGGSSSLIDICVTNSKNIVQSGTIEYNISDHLMVFAVSKSLRHDKGIEKCKQKIRSFRSYDVELVKESLNNFNWGRYFATKNVDVAWSILFNEMVKNADFFAPYCTRFVKKYQPYWFTSSLLELSIERDRLFSAAKKSNDKELFKKAKKKRNEVKTLICNARSSYYINKTEEYSGNPKKFWRELNNIAFKGKGNDKKITNVLDPISGKLADLESSSNIINEFFVNIGENLDKALPEGNDPGTLNLVYVDEMFNCEPNITVNMVEDLINKIDLSKSSGCHKISARLYKDFLEILSEQLTYLFNLSITTGKIPIAWKSGVVTPLPKKGDITQPNNIRPITQTHILGKMLERIISDKLISFFETNQLFYPKQMGFRSGYSTSLAISDFVADVNLAQNENNVTGCIYIDVCKAFDCIKPKILLSKLEKYGLSQNMLKWFGNYFSNRKQTVKINNIISKPLCNKYGVPQGSILGPLMFLIYINDLPLLDLKSKVILYADDMIIYYSHPEWTNINQVLRNDLNKIYNWTLFNRLTINFSKSKFQIFGNKWKLNQLNYETKIDIGNETLQRVDRYNYLGITLDSELKFEIAMAEAYSKYAYRLYTLSIIRKDISRFAALSIVKSMMLPHFDYMLFVSTPCCDKTMTKSQRLVNRSLRIVYHADRHTRLDDLYDRAKIMKLEIRRRFNIIKLMHTKIYHRELETIVVSQVNTRLFAGPVLNIPIPRYSKFQRSLYYVGHVLWNSLPVYLRVIRDSRNFKRELKRFVLQYN